MNVDRLVKAVASVLPERRPIGHHEPYINGKELSNVAGALGDIRDGIWVKQLEGKLAAYTGVENAIAVNSGTAALHVALLAAGVLPGDEVLVPTLTFTATAAAVRYVGAYPHFIDGPLGLNPFKFRQYIAGATVPAARGRLNPKTGRTVSAVLVVDLLGFPADMPKLVELGEGYGLTVIEDAAQALGSSLGNKRCGSFGSVATLSFNNNKIVTSNGGGCVLTNDPWIAAKAAQLATTARVPHPWLIEHDDIGFNYRLPTINAALALAQLEQLDEFLAAKKLLHERYKEALAVCDEVEVLETNLPNAVSNYWLTTIMLKPLHVAARDKILAALYETGIHARALFKPLHQQPMYADCPRSDLSYAEYTYKRAICLPSGVALCQGSQQ